MAPGRSRAEVQAAISAGLAGLYARHYGKGPTEVRTHLEPGLVVSLLRGGFSAVEETLIADRRAASVIALRRAFQESMRAEFSELVESQTGRPVAAYLSQVHVEPNLSVEVFVLGEDGPG